VNLTPWCSLFSNASKFSISVKKSQYRTLFQITSVVVCLLLMLIFFTYAYLLALSIAVIFIILFGLLNAKINQQPIDSTFEINSQGLCSFEDNNIYQVQANSRFSFLGCWLVLQTLPSNGLLLNTEKNNFKNVLFIYRDSLSKQDFSRLSRIISQLNHHH